MQLKHAREPLDHLALDLNVFLRQADRGEVSRKFFYVARIRDVTNVLPCRSPLAQLPFCGAFALKPSK